MTLPESVTYLGDYAFRECISLTSIAMRDRITYIGEGAFDDCYSLTSIAIPNSVTYIGSYAFEDCISFTSIVIPNSVESMENDIFSGCRNLTIYCEADSEPSGWMSGWNYSKRPVYWAGEWSYVDGVATPNPITDQGASIESV